MRLPLTVHVNPVHEMMVLYEAYGQIFNAALIDGDGDLLLVTDNWRYKIIHVSQVYHIAPAARYSFSMGQSHA